MKPKIALAILKSQSMGLSQQLRYEHQTDEIGLGVDFEKTVRYTEVIPQHSMIKRVSSITSDYSPPVTITEYTTLDGHYVGDQSTFEMLVERGIEPQLASPDHTVCSIGYCARENAWYGWSHRAINKFTIGSEVKYGDCAYQPSSIEMFQRIRDNYYREDRYDDVNVNILDPKTLNISYRSGDLHANFTETVHLGKGEWVAYSLEDAKTMATHFAASVSCCTIDASTDDVSTARSTFNNGLADMFKAYFSPEVKTSLDRALRNNPYAQEVLDKLKAIENQYSEEASSNITKTNLMIKAQKGLLALISESKARVLQDKDLNSGNFAWYEYTSSKPSSYDHHSKNLELTIERGEFFGICFDAVRRKYLVTTLDSFYKGAPKLVTFQLSKPRATNLIKRGRVPSIHKVEGIPITRGNGDTDQSYHGNTAYDFNDVEIQTSESKIGYLGYFVSDVFKRDLIVIANDDADALKAHLTKAMSRSQNLASPGVMVAVAKKSNIYQSVISQRGNSKTMTVSHTTPIMESAIKVLDSAYVPKGLDVKTGGSELRPTRTDLPKRKQFITESNIDNVLMELVGFISNDKYFSNAFTAVTRKSPRDHGNKRIVTLRADLNDPLHEVEADALIRRVESFYLVPIAGKRYKTVKGIRTTGKFYDGGKYIAVIFYVKMPRPWQGVHAAIASRISELEKEGKLDRTIRYTTMVVGEPKPVQVDIHKVNPEQASIEVRGIRSGELMKVTNLYDTTGKKRIL